MPLKTVVENVKTRPPDAPILSPLSMTLYPPILNRGLLQSNQSKESPTSKIRGELKFTKQQPIFLFSDPFFFLVTHFSF
jgi:hypothetical protein